MEVNVWTHPMMNYVMVIRVNAAVDAVVILSQDKIL